MQALAGLTGGAVYEGNAARCCRTARCFRRCSRTSKRRIAPCTWKPSCGPRAKSNDSSSMLLCSKVPQGVKVRLLIDALGGSGATRARLQQLRDAGVELAEYCRPRVVESAALQSPHASQAPHRRRRDRLHVRPRHRRSVARRRRRQGSLARHGRAPGRSGGRRAAVGVHGELDRRDAAASPRATAAIRRWSARATSLLTSSAARRKKSAPRSRCCTPWRSHRRARK